MPDNEPAPIVASGDEDLLKDIQEDYQYYREYWRPNFEEAKIDLRFVSGDPWDADERANREDNSRPVLSPDEIGQYLNAAINNMRQNPRAIKISPTGEGANDEQADMRAAIIKAIEYSSNAQSAYTNAFECAINCGIGFFRVTTKFVRGSKDVEPQIKVIENPLSVLIDPNAKEADFSDQKRCFVMDIMRQRDFKSRFPKAQKTSFSSTDFEQAPDWLQGQNVLIAEYWRIDDYDENGLGGKVTQYLTNGVEILEKNPWPGSWVPIVPTVGKKIYKPVGSQMQRMYYSMVRLARGPQMMLAYIASQEAEEYGMAPRAPFVGYVGQFETDAAAWETVNKIPRAYLQIDPVVDQASGQILPMPTRPAFSPNAQAYEIGREAWRRAIQAAMGITPLPTAAQRQNEKSGVALDKIQTQQAIGSYHFTDNFDRALENCGRQLNELITVVMDTPRQVSGRMADDSHKMIHVAPGGKKMQGIEGEDSVFDPTKGQFAETVSTGISYDSQRQEASQTVDLIIQNLATLPIDPHVKPKILSLGIKLKDIGPIGDELSKILDPEPDGGPIPPQAQQAIAQGQQQLQALNAHAQQLEQELGKYQFEAKAKVVEHQGKMEEIAAKGQADMALEDKKLLTQITVAEISTKSQILSEREAALNDLEAQLHAQSHEIAMQKDQQAHAQDLAAQQAQQQSQLTDQQAQNQSQQSAQDAAQTQAQQEAQAQQQPSGGTTSE